MVHHRIRMSPFLTVRRYRSSLTVPEGGKCLLLSVATGRRRSCDSRPTLVQLIPTRITETSKRTACRKKFGLRHKHHYLILHLFEAHRRRKKAFLHTICCRTSEWVSTLLVREFFYRPTIETMSNGGRPEGASSSHRSCRSLAGHQPTPTSSSRFSDVPRGRQSILAGRYTIGAELDVEPTACFYGFRPERRSFCSSEADVLPGDSLGNIANLE